MDENGLEISGAGATPQATPDADDSTARAASFRCTPYSGVDNSHYSSGDVSGHGWWDRGNCGSSVSTATVYNCLYEYYTDATWRRKACSPKKTLKPGGGSVQRTVARARCNPTSAYISWRNHVDVDVNGKADTPEEPYKQANVVCVVY